MWDPFEPGALLSMCYCDCNGYTPMATAFKAHIFQFVFSAKSLAPRAPIRAEMGSETGIRRGMKLPTLIIKLQRRSDELWSSIFTLGSLPLPQLLPEAKQHLRVLGVWVVCVTSNNLHFICF